MFPCAAAQIEASTLSKRAQACRTGARSDVVVYDPRISRSMIRRSRDCSTSLFRPTLAYLKSIVPIRPDEIEPVLGHRTDDDRAKRWGGGN